MKLIFNQFPVRQKKRYDKRSITWLVRILQLATNFHRAGIDHNSLGVRVKVASVIGLLQYGRKYEGNVCTRNHTSLNAFFSPSNCL